MTQRAILKILKKNNDISEYDITEQIRSSLIRSGKSIPENLGTKIAVAISVLEDIGQIKREDGHISITDIGLFRISQSESRFICALEANYVNRMIKKANESAHETLNLPTPERVRCITPSGEHREVIIRPASLTASSLREDVKIGAKKFEPLLNCTSADLNSRITIIRCVLPEDGYKAVSYLSSLNERRTEFFPLHLADKDSFALSFWRPDEEEYDNVFPVIKASQLKHENDFQLFNFGNTAGSGANHRPISRYWEGYTGDVVLINDNAGFYNFSLVDAIQCLSENNHVYVICSEGSAGSSDFIFTEPDDSVNPDVLKAIMQYDAASFAICPSADERGYFNFVYEGLLKRYGVKESNDFPRNDFIDAIRELEPQFSSELMDQVIKRASNRYSSVLNSSVMRELKKIDASPNKISGWERLNGLYGLGDVKAEIRKLINSLKINKIRKEKGLSASYTSCIAFLGAPGTAKTSVAEILADILFEEKLLPGRRFASVTGSGLQAEYVGQTAERVREYFYSNDVLLIDEFYSLALDNDDGTYKSEVLAELCVLIEEAAKAGNKLIILAGYGGEDSTPENNLMIRALRSNPGILSRVSSVINFGSYSPKDCKDIFFSIASSNNYQVAPDTVAEVSEDIENYFVGRCKDPDFGNGRECRSIFQECSRIAADRISQTVDVSKMPVEDLSTLTSEDIRKAIASCEKMDASKRGKETAISII